MSRLIIVLTAVIRVLAVLLMIAGCFGSMDSILAKQLTDSPAGKILEDYLAALNSGQEGVMRAFLEESVSPEALKVRPIELRLQVMLDLKKQWNMASLIEVRSITDSSLTALIKTADGDWFEFTLFHDQSRPVKMLAIRIMEAEPPADSSLPPLKQQQMLEEAARLLEARVKADQFSGVVLIARDGKPMFLQAVGQADIGLGVPNRPDTKFNLGSINKKFTQLGIDLLAEQDKLSLDDPIGKYLQDYPNKVAASKVTIGHLLRMEGGIGDFFGEAFVNTPKDKLRHNHDFIRLFADEELHFEPGTRSEYSNGGYILLGAIIEKVSGEDYYDFVRKNVFIPAGMSNTDWFEADVITPNLAQGYTLEESPDGKRRSNIYTRPARGSAAGGGYSTAEDLLKFVNAVSMGKFGPVSIRYGGLGIAGGAPGMNAALESDLRGGFAVIVLSNYDPPSAQELARELRRLIARVVE